MHPMTPAIRLATTPAQVTGASPGKKPLRDPSARERRSRTAESSKCPTPTGPETAASSRPCNVPVIWAFAAVPRAFPIGSRTRENAYSNPAMTRAPTSREPAVESIPCWTAPGMKPTTAPSAPTTSAGRRALATTQTPTKTQRRRLEVHSSDQACRPLARSVDVTPTEAIGAR